jgi:hypothetical protein
MHELQCFKFNAFEYFICIRFISNVPIITIYYKHCHGMHNHTNMTHPSYNQCFFGTFLWFKNYINVAIALAHNKDGFKRF